METRTLLLQLAVVVLAARVVGGAARRLGQPRVVGEICAGLLLGPSLLGWVAPRALEVLFPPASVGVLEGISQIGILIFMFLVGLEIDLAALRSLGKVALVTSQVSIVVPLVLGTILGSYVAPKVELVPAPAATALFIGVAMSVTAFPVLARILVDHGLVRLPLGAVALACAAVDDVSAWCMLAGLNAFVRAGRYPSAVLLTVALLAAYGAAMLLLVRPALARLSRRLPQDGPAWLPVALSLMLVSALVTEQIGVHALFGAFIAGVALPRSEPLRKALASRMEPLTAIVLLPLFFALTGLRTDLTRLRGGDWGVFGLILVVAILGKLAGSALTAWTLGTPWRDALALGVLLNTRGLVELVILDAGLQLGVIGPRMYSMLVVMALVTTAMASPVLAALGLGRPPKRGGEEGYERDGG